MIRRSMVLLATSGAVLGAVPGIASAQMANCGMANSPQMRQWCYQQQMNIYRQQQQYYNDMARRQWQMHQNTGRFLRRAPVIGPYAAPAWNAPRYYYQYRYGRPY